MKNKCIILSLFIIMVLLFSTTICYATNIMDEPIDNMKDAIEGTKNVVQDTAEGIGTGVKNSAEFVGNTISNTGETIKNNTNINKTNNNYIAAKTSTDTTPTNNNLFGIGNTTWTWIIMTIAGIGIIAIVWYYGKEHELVKRKNHNDY